MFGAITIRTRQAHTTVLAATDIVSYSIYSLPSHPLSQLFHLTTLIDLCEQVRLAMKQTTLKFSGVFLGTVLLAVIQANREGYL